MPNRVIKEAITTSSRIDALSAHAEVLFYRLLVVADDFGYMDARLPIVKARCFPLKDYGNPSIEQWLAELAANELIARYTVSGQPYLSINQWSQRLRIQQSKYPAPNHPDARVFDLNVNFPDQDLPDVGQMTVIRQSDDEQVSARKEEKRSRSRNEEKDIRPVALDDSPSQSDSVRTVFDHWKRTMNHPKALLDAKRDRVIRARLKDGYTAEQLCLAVDGCKASEFHMGANDSHQVYDDIELICRGAANVEKFISMSESPTKGRLSKSGQQTAASLRGFLGEGG